MHKFDPSIIREYDIRGVVGETLSAEDAYHLGRKFATYTWAKRICVGFDGRLSSPELAQSLITGLIESDVDVINIGLGPTPMLYYSVFHMDADAGIMVTGSHNPPKHNGFKMMNGKDSLFGKEIAELAKVDSYIVGRGREKTFDIKDFYIRRLLSDLKPNKFNVAWDPGNGAAGSVVNSLTKELEGNNFLINDQIDGTFPSHHPDPTQEKNLEQLKRLVANNKCDVGFAFDGDGDRLGIIDEKGNVIWGDQILAILAREVLANNPKASIIADVKSSQLFADEVERLGGKPIYWKTGHSLIKAKMKELNSPLAGEMSAHIFINDGYYGFDDGVYAAIRFLNVMTSSGMKASELLDSLPKYHSSPEYRVPCPEERKFAIIEEIKQKLEASNAHFNDIDGVRVNEEGGWWLLRASNTGAEIVARCEGKDEADLAAIRHKMEQTLREFDLEI